MNTNINCTPDKCPYMLRCRNFYCKLFHPDESIETYQKRVMKNMIYTEAQKIIKNPTLLKQYFEKSKFCKYKESCKLGRSCTYAHSLEEYKPPQCFYKEYCTTKDCILFHPWDTIPSYLSSQRDLPLPYNRTFGERERTFGDRERTFGERNEAPFGSVHKGDAEIVTPRPQGGLINGQSPPEVATCPPDKLSTTNVPPYACSPQRYGLGVERAYGSTTILPRPKQKTFAETLLTPEPKTEFCTNLDVNQPCTIPSCPYAHTLWELKPKRCPNQLPCENGRMCSLYHQGEDRLDYFVRSGIAKLVRPYHV